jgi:hypothetical protein
MAFKKNVVKADVRSYPPYVIMGVPKIGKTTLFRDLILEIYKDEDKGVLLSFGDEEGHKSLDRLQCEEIDDWDLEYETNLDGSVNEDSPRGFVQVVDDLVENKETNGIEAVGLDTWDKLVEIATREAYEIHRRLKGAYPKSLNDALGGYGAGGKKVVELMMGQVARLRKAGYAVFVMAHTKKKDKTDVMTGEAYEQITNDLISTFYNPIANVAQMIVNIAVEREIKDNKQIGTKRMMYFRDNGIVDAGGRFVGLPEKMELSAENFMIAFNTGVKNSMMGSNPSVTDEDLAKKREAEKAELDKKAKAVKDKENKEKNKATESARKKEIISIFQSKAASLDATVLGVIKGINTRYGITNYNDPDNLPIEALEEILIAIDNG